MSAIRKFLSEKTRAVVAPMRYWPRTLRMIWHAAPGWNVAWLSLLVIQGVLPAAAVFLIKLLVDSLVAAKNTGGARPQVQHALVLLLIMAVLLLLTEVLQSLIEWVRTAQSELVLDHIKNLVHEQAAALDLSFYESPEYYDLLEQARSEASNRPITLLESFGSLLQNGITLIAMSAVLVAYSTWLPVVLLASTLPALYVVIRFERTYHRWWQRMTAERRWASYYDTMLTHDMPAAEVRLFGLSKYYRAQFQKLRRTLLNARLTQMRKLAFAKAGAGIAALAVSGIAMVWISWRALHGKATLGDLALFYQAFNRGQSLMRQLLGSVGQIIANSLYLGNLFAYLELKPKIVAPEKPAAVPAVISRGIDFRHVTFCYPGSDRPALRDFSLSIPAGKVVAVVGENGAGKSTLLKLLCRFYDPQSGRIEVDGNDISKFAPADLWRLITVLFQFHMQYHATAHTNIALGDIEANLSPDEIKEAAIRAGAHELITRLPEGYDSLLGRWFLSGAELSGGEWQRIALARAYVRRSQIILLDEPTSFMDSWAEADWFKRFRELAEGRTAIIITHRFTIAMRADIIHVIQEGQIIESGSHQELLRRGGFYAQSWKTQMQAAGADDANVSEAIEPLPNEDFELAKIGS